jgi:transcription elongation GreA/GreB family factor
MNEELQQAVESGKLTRQSAEVLDKLAPGAFCRHKSWGFGRVAEWSLLTGQIIIDFQTRKGHPMQAQYAAETLQPIPDNHILARKATNADAARVEAGEAPVKFLASILSDLGGKATVEEIASSLSPEVFDAAGFKKWWDATKKKLKADGHFQLPTKKTDPVVLLDAPASPAKGLFENFRAARYMKDQVAALEQITKALDDFAQEVEELQILASQIEDAAHKGRKLQASHALELLLSRDEIFARHSALKPGENAPSVADILVGEEKNLPALFLALPAAKQKRAIEQFPKAFGDRWEWVLLKLLQTAPARLVTDIAKYMEKEGRTEDLRTALTKWISERSVSAEILIWLAKERGGSFPELFNADLFGAMLSTMERDQLAEKKGARLHDLIMDDRELLGDLLAEAETEVVRDAMRRLLLTVVFQDLNKRSLLGRIVKLYPEMQSMIVSGEETERDETITVSWASLEKRKEEYEDLINRQIPQNTKDISIARSYGDLRENFEFKSAKEQQRVLLRRKSETERDLNAARGTNFENPDTAQVSIGTVVTIRDEAGHEETYSILGAWDSAPEIGVVSYKAGIGQSLLGKKPGESVALPTETGTRTVTVGTIETFKNLELLRTKVHVLQNPQEEATTN